MIRTAIIALIVLNTACGTSSSQSDSGTSDASSDGDGDAAPSGKVIFVVPMENQDYVKVIGNAADAPYINGTLLPAYASASNFQDELSIPVPSEPHYVWMESGTNAFADHTFTNDNDPSSANSTTSTPVCQRELRHFPSS